MKKYLFLICLFFCLTSFSENVLDGALGVGTYTDGAVYNHYWTRTIGWTNSNRNTATTGRIIYSYSVDGVTRYVSFSTHNSMPGLFNDTVGNVSGLDRYYTEGYVNTYPPKFLDFKPTGEVEDFYKVFLPVAGDLTGDGLSDYYDDAKPLEMDRDGVDDTVELLAGTDPTDSTSFPYVDENGNIVGPNGTFSAVEFAEVYDFLIDQMIAEQQTILPPLDVSNFDDVVLNTNLDSDNDDINDQIEFNAGSDPFDSTSTPDNFDNSYTPTIIDPDTGGTINNPINDWDYLKNRTEIIDSKTQDVIGYIYDNNIVKVAVLKANDGTIYHEPLDNMRHIPILDYREHTGNGEANQVIVDFPNIPNKDPDNPDSPYSPPPNVLPPDSGGSSGGSTVTTNTTNNVTNNYTTGGDGTAFDDTAILDKLEEINDNLKIETDLQNMSFDEQLSTFKSDFITGLKNSYESSYHQAMSSLPDGFVLPSDITVSRSAVPSVTFFGHTFNILSNPLVVNILSVFRFAFLGFLYFYFIRKFWEHHRISG